MSEPATRKIIHIDMDAFYASVEQRDRPELKGLPVAVGGSPDKRGVVAAASYEARKYGIHSAMASHQAIKRCKNLIFLPPRFEVYQAVSRQIRQIFSDYTDWIEPLSLDEAYLDVTENKKSNPSATWIAREIKQRIVEETRLTASAGVSYNKFLAKVASDVNKPDGLFVIPPHRAEAFMMALPIDTFYGVGKVTAARMKELGIFTGQDLFQCSEDELIRYFGKSGAYFYQVVRGQDDRPVCPLRERKSIGSEHTFVEDLSHVPDMIAAFDFLADDVLDWMRSHRTYGRTLTVKVKYADFTQVTRSRTRELPLVEKADMLSLAEALLHQTQVSERPVRLLGMSFSNLMSLESFQPTPDRVIPRQLKLPLDSMF